MPKRQIRIRYVQERYVQVIDHNIVESPQLINAKVEDARVVFAIVGQKILFREVRYHLNIKDHYIII